MGNLHVKTVAILGAGTMGAQLAACFANAGIMTYLFDLDSDLADSAKNNLIKIKPEPLHSKSALKLIGTYSYSHSWFKKTDFYEKYKNILVDKTGLGYFLWKSYIINDAINKMKDGELLFYTDVGDMFHSDLIPFVNEIIEDDPCLLMVGNSINKEWTRRDCFFYMDCDEEDYWNSNQLEAGISIWKVCDESKKIISEWLEYA